MKLQKELNIRLDNPETKPFLADVFYPDADGKFPLIVFVHGYKGYKDWGTWDLMAEKIASAGYVFVKFNMSHNGTSLENPYEFTDMDSFGKNNYSKELSDLKLVINHFLSYPKVDSQTIGVIGHSRGGAISIINTFEDERIDYLVTLGSIDTLDRFPKGEKFEEWKENGIYHIINARTKQEMPHEFQFYEDYKKNLKRFDVEAAMEQINANILIIHGTNDEAVNHQAAENLNLWSSKSDLILIEDANHTFGGKEPWESNQLPEDLEIAIDEIIEFLNEQ